MSASVYSTHQAIYRQAKSLLQAIPLDPSAPDLRTTFAVSLSQLQQLFQQGLQLDGSAEATELRELQPLQIEINKQMRLLETDAIFLKAARQVATLEQRCQQIQTRVSLLLSYCEAILQLCAVEQ
jgi:hypothetical protein